jgi:hypothetical protein
MGNSVRGLMAGGKLTTSIGTKPNNPTPSRSQISKERCRRPGLISPPRFLRTMRRCMISLPQA